MREFSNYIFDSLVVDEGCKSGLKWSDSAVSYVAGRMAGKFHSRFGYVVQVLCNTYRCGDVVMFIKSLGEHAIEPVDMSKKSKSRSGLKGVKVIRKAKNNGVTGYLPRIKRKDFSWTGDIQTDKRVAAAMVDAKLIEIDGDKAVTNKSLGLI